MSPHRKVSTRGASGKRAASKSTAARSAAAAAAAADRGDLDRVRRAIRRVRPELSPRHLTPSASLVADLGIDSLALAELSIALEDEFQRPVFMGDVLADLEEPANITVGELARYLARER